MLHLRKLESRNAFYSSIIPLEWYHFFSLFFKVGFSCLTLYGDCSVPRSSSDRPFPCLVVVDDLRRPTILLYNACFFFMMIALISFVSLTWCCCWALPMFYAYCDKSWCNAHARVLSSFLLAPWLAEIWLRSTVLWWMHSFIPYTWVISSNQSFPAECFKTPEYIIMKITSRGEIRNSLLLSYYIGISYYNGRWKSSKKRRKP